MKDPVIKEPEVNEDAKNFTTIAISGALGLLLTVGIIGLRAAPEPSTPEPVRVEVAVEPVVFETEPIEVEIEEPAVEAVVVEPVSGSNRIYGTVHTRRGGSYTGFIRWDRNEGSWADMLDANKETWGRTTTSGIRFGHVSRIDVTGSRGADFRLKDGSTVALEARSTDLGTGLRALRVDDPERGSIEFKWRDLESIDFRAAPERAMPREARLYGTLSTRDGDSFTGYVTWDIDEIYTTDVLDGEDRFGDDREIPFGEIASIARNNSNSARVVLRSGEEMVLRGTNDVNRSNGGITVSDPALGEVKVRWSDFDQVEFHEATFEAGYGYFTGARPIRGTVLTRDGQEYSGEVLWDEDESSSWEMLNGKIGSVEFQIEFGNIARITRTARGAEVVLQDGRTFLLRSSNDVDDGNRGITIRSGGGAHDISWDDFRELRIAG